MVSNGEETDGAGKIIRYKYSTVAIYAPLERDGDNTVVEMTEVTAKIPEATDYAHIHFGVWAGLGAPDEDGDQDIADLGIGFVQNYSGEGLTPTGGGKDDMPNSGVAKYSNADWVAAVRAADGQGNGDISLVNGPATLDADFGEGTIEATLTGLATLTGTIAGNTFSGTKATVADNTHSLTDGAAFTGTFGGGFYGAQAAEAGGVFDFTSKDAEAGEFRGAFGGAE